MSFVPSLFVSLVPFLLTIDLPLGHSLSFLMATLRHPIVPRAGLLPSFVCVNSRLSLLGVLVHPLPLTECRRESMRAVRLNAVITRPRKTESGLAVQCETVKGKCCLHLPYSRPFSILESPLEAVTGMDGGTSPFFSQDYPFPAFLGSTFAVISREQLPRGQREESSRALGTQKGRLHISVGTSPKTEVPQDEEATCRRRRTHTRG